ncbi:MAG: DUF898 family protein [Sneathiella sp.]
MPDQGHPNHSGFKNMSWSRGDEDALAPFISFDVSRKDLVVRLLKNKLFGVLTLGLYRFWGKTHLRKILWPGIKIKQDRLEYHGTAKELFIGFLIAMALLGLLFTVVGIGLQFLFLSNPDFLGVEQVLNFLLLYGFWQFARYRLWRFRLSRTSLRTIRFFLRGKALVYTGKILLWSLLSAVTVGWAYPYMRAVRASYFLNNVSFGDQSLKCTNDPARFYKIYWPVIVFVQVVLVSTAFYLEMMTSFQIADLADIGSVTEVNESLIEIMGVLVFAGFAAFLMLIVARVKEFRYLVQVSQFAGARFTSTLPVSRMLLIFGLLALVSVAAYIGIFALIVGAIAITPELLLVSGIAVFIGVYLLFDILKYFFLFIPMMKAVCSSLKTTNHSVFEEVAASSETSPKYGEGLADALDVGAF